MLDAGVGTGWCGPQLRPYARRLVGVDLSPDMLRKASERQAGGRKIYDELAEAELTAFMRARPAAFDLIVSADTLVYFGALDEVLQAAAGSLRAGGPSGRSPSRRRGTSRAAAFSSTRTAATATPRPTCAARSTRPASRRWSIERATLRKEIKLPVDGFVVTARLAPPLPAAA